MIAKRKNDLSSFIETSEWIYYPDGGATFECSANLFKSTLVVNRKEVVMRINMHATLWPWYNTVERMLIEDFAYWFHCGIHSKDENNPSSCCLCKKKGWKSRKTATKIL